MAKHKSSGGSTMYGVLAGLLIGLGLAAGVAFYVLKAPMPFMDKASRSPDAPGAPDPRNAPDPNAALSGQDVGAKGQGGDTLGSLIATLTPPPEAAARASQSAPSTAPPPVSVPPSANATAQAKASGPYYLQVGSFRVLEDAEALRAKIILMGMPVEIQRAEVNGLQVNRVRVGPFTKIDDMNQTRTRLGQEKIPTAVVRQ